MSGIPCFGEFGSGLEQAVADIERCETVEELNRELQRIIGRFGFAAYCFLDITEAANQTLYYFGTTGERWEQEYIDNKFFDVDEVIKFARRSNTPFVWSDVPLPARLGVKKPGALKAFEAAADFRFREGLVIPLHFADAKGRRRSALCSLIWQDSLESFRRVTRAGRIDLHIVLVYWMQRSIELREALERGLKLGDRKQRREESLVLGLTDRERDVLSWAARGKTFAETATILAISLNTVVSHMKNATEKLGTGNKTHAVAVAVQRGLIDL